MAKFTRENINKEPMPMWGWVGCIAGHVFPCKDYGGGCRCTQCLIYEDKHGKRR